MKGDRSIQFHQPHPRGKIPFRGLGGAIEQLARETEDKIIKDDEKAANLGSKSRMRRRKSRWRQEKQRTPPCHPPPRVMRVRTLSRLTPSPSFKSTHARTLKVIHTIFHDPSATHDWVRECQAFMGIKDTQGSF